MAEPLASWNDGATKSAVLEFVERVSADGIPPEERIAVFDNDGTLWCEKPLPIQADFILRRLAEMAEADPELRKRQPWQAAYEWDYAWLGKVMEEHYAGDDTNVRTLLGGVLSRNGISVDDFEEQADSFLHSANIHPRSRLSRARLRADGRAVAIPRGEWVLELHRLCSGRDFMRPISEEVRHPARPCDRELHGARLHERRPRRHDHAQAGGRDVLDDGPQKPIRIWSRVGRRPILAAGNSNGDVPMLDFTQHADKLFLRLLVLHDDAEREFAYTAGAEHSLERARAEK